MGRAGFAPADRMARNTLVINCDLRETRVALIEDGVIAELHIERANARGAVGNVVLGKVTRVLPGMQAAFIDVGMDRAAFLHVEDLIRPDDFEAYLAGAHREDEGPSGKGEGGRRRHGEAGGEDDEDDDEVVVGPGEGNGNGEVAAAPAEAQVASVPEVEPAHEDAEDEDEDEDEGGRDGAAPATRRGPLLHDLARLLLDPARFDPAQPQEEDQVIDAAVRWWQAARRTLPLGEALAQDFGECWRALEWMALLQQLQRIGELCQAGPSPELAPLLASATRIALRYGPLSPVLLRLAPLSGQAPASGFTF